MDAMKTCLLALVCILMPWHGHIFLIQSFNIEDDGSQSAALLVSTETCALSDLVNGTGGNISYCDNSDGSIVPNSHWCDVTDQTESGNNIHMTYRCVEGVWRREFGTDTELAIGSVRHKRFFWLAFIPVIAKLAAFGSAIAITCVVSGECSTGANDDDIPPPKFTSCPPDAIKAQKVYYAPRGQNAATVVWTEPASEGTEVTSSLTCCGNRASGESFLGSFTGTNYDMTYTVKDKNGKTDSCNFNFTVFFLACAEPSPSPTRIKQGCTHGLLYGSECTFGCIDGYSVNNGSSSSSMCEKESDITVNWTTLPECEKKRCTAPVAPANGNVSCRSPQYDFDTECTFSCNIGYRLSGPSTVYCQSDRSWSTADVKCTDDESPTITCSSHVIYADRGALTAKVFWSEPLVTDNVDNDLKAKKLSNVSQGDLLQEGKYYIPYRAIDSANNSHPLLSECNITVQVQVIKCASGPTDSLNNKRFLLYNCSDLAYYSGVKCNLSCDLNLDLNGTDTISCERNGTFGDGVWEWDGDAQPHCNVVQCPPLNPPAYGAMTYDSVNARPVRVMLCQSGYDSPSVGASFTGRLSCQDSGMWYPLERFPDCVKPKFANMVVLVDLIYEGNCSSSGTQDVIKQKVLQYISQIQEDVDKSICPGKDCKVDNLVVVCGSNRRRRSSSITSGSRISKRQTSYARVAFDLSTPLILSNATADEAYDERLPLLEAIIKRITADIVNGSFDIDGYTLDIETFTTSDPILTCPTYQKLDRSNTCKPCPKGTYINSTTGNCELCNIGEYNEEDGRAECDLCPPDHSTLKTGSTHHNNCTRYCDPGFASRTSMVPCFACYLGSYQPQKSATTCIPCPVGRTTQSTSSTNLNQCTLFDLKVNNLRGSQVVGTFKSDVNLSILTINLYARKDIDDSEELTLTIRDETSDVLVVRLGKSNTTIEIGNMLLLSNFKLLTKRWAHLLIELHFSSYLLTVYTDGKQEINQTVVPFEYIQSGTIQMNSNAETGITLSGLAVYPRNLTSEERTSLASMCHLSSADALLSMADFVHNRVEGLSLVIPTSCDPIDECIDSPCGIHTCKNEIGAFTCVCSGGWTGTRCEVAPDYCLNHDCKHGTCVTGSGTYTCNCTDFFTGSDCSIPPVNGGWSSWSEWSGCDVTCGGGTQTHKRLCVEPVPGPGGLDCTGLNEETQTCNNKKCPVCTKLKRAYGTQIVCNDDPIYGDIRCNASCLAGLTFPSGQEPYPQYTCGRSTGYEWIPFFQVTTCMGYSAPVKVGYKSSANLNVNVSITETASMEQAFSKNIQTVPCVAENTCSVNVSITNMTERRKRSARSSITISFSVQLPELNDLDIASFIQTETVSSDLQRLRDAYLVVHDLATYIHNNSETIFTVTITGVQYKADLASINSYLVVYCHPGFSGTENMCVECPIGTHEVNAVCRTCVVGTYQSLTGQTTCEPCPTGYTTPTVMATGIEECNVLVTSLTTTEPHGDDKQALEHEKSVSKAVLITVVVISVLVFAVAIVIGVLCYNKTRKQSRISRSRSLASINMVYPHVARSIEQSKMVQPKAEQSNVRFTQDEFQACSSTPPPYDELPRKK